MVGAALENKLEVFVRSRRITLSLLGAGWGLSCPADSGIDVLGCD